MSSTVVEDPLVKSRLGKRVRVPPRVVLGEFTANNVGTLRKLNSVLFPVQYSDRFYKDVLNVDIVPEDFSKLVFYQDLAVGNISCRLEPVSAPAQTHISNSLAPTVAPVASSSTSKSAPKASTEPQKLYIMTLGVLAPYRNQGLGSKLLKHVISQAEASHRPPVVPEAKPKADAPPADKKKKGDKEKPAASKPPPAPAPKPVIASLYLHVQVSNDEARAFYEKHGFRVTSTAKDYFRKIEPRDAWILEREITAQA